MQWCNYLLTLPLKIKIKIKICGENAQLSYTIFFYLFTYDGKKGDPGV